MEQNSFYVGSVHTCIKTLSLIHRHIRVKTHYVRCMKVDHIRRIIVLGRLNHMQKIVV
jgi:hypothetical protein